jgi:archaellum component FlaF (FlaF/FlaG flagellin family)
MLITLTAPAFADTWCIENGDITVKAGDTKGTNKVSQGDKKDVEDTNTIITNQKTDKASSNTVTIEANGKNDKVEVTLKDVNIDTSSRNNAAVSVTGSGNTTIKLDGDNHLAGGNGIYSNSSGSLTISGDENDSLTAQGGDSRNGIYSVSGDVTISGGTVTATGGNSTGSYGSGGDGIHSGSLTISGGTVTATGGDSTGSNGLGGRGICSDSGGITISGGSTVTANGGNGSSGRDGISSSSGVTVSDGTVTATGGNSTGSYGSGGDGIRSDGGVTISGGTVKAAGGDSKNGSGGDGIRSGDIDLSGSLELTAKAGSPNGKALSQRGNELDLNTIKDKLGPGAKVTTTDADGKVIDQVPIPRPVEPEEPVIPGESSSSSDGGSAAPSAPASPLPGLTVTDKSGAVISYTSTQSGNTLTVCVGRLTASFRISLAALRQLRAEGIETITFQTILCSTTLSVDELLAMGGEDAEAVLTHRSTDSSLTVG